MKLIFAGSGLLVEKLITAILPEFGLPKVVLTNKMTEQNIASMISFCDAKKIYWQFGFDGIYGDIFITANYPSILSPKFVNEHLCVNIHCALLPRYRGFHPLQCAFLNDDKECGYTVHRLDAGIDSGPIYFQQSFSILESDNIHTINARIIENIVAEFPYYIEAISMGKQAIPQDDNLATYCGRRHPEDGIINWNEKSRYIFNLIRSLSPPYYPGAYTFLGNKKVIVTEAKEYVTQSYRHTVGQIVDSRSGYGLLVKTGDTLLWVKRIKIDEGEEGFAEDLVGRKIGVRFRSAPLL